MDLSHRKNGVESGVPVPIQMAESLRTGWDEISRLVLDPRTMPTHCEIEGAISLISHSGKNIFLAMFTCNEPDCRMAIPL